MPSLASMSRHRGSMPFWLMSTNPLSVPLHICRSNGFKEAGLTSKQRVINEALTATQQGQQVHLTADSNMPVAHIHVPATQRHSCTTSEATGAKHAIKEACCPDPV
jgi:hypothetical protein